MAQVHDSINIAASCDVVFAQLTTFEEYPRFMAGVSEVRRQDERHLHWRAERNGRVEEWDSELIDIIPPHRLAWRTEGRVGVVTCRLTPWGRARVSFRMDQEPLLPTVDGRHYLEAVRQRLHADLENLRERVEETERRKASGKAGRNEPVLPA